MNHQNAPSDKYLDVYDSVGESSTELLLQPRCSRNRIMGKAWQGLIIFILLVLPFLTILPTAIAMVAIVALINIYIPSSLNLPIAHGAVILLWVGCLGVSIYLTWKTIYESGYTTFIFDRIQKQLVINTANIIGRNSVRTISFDRIRDAYFREDKSDGISISVGLLLDKFELGVTSPQKEIMVSIFASEETRTVETLTLREQHQELLLLVRTALGFSTSEILAQLRNNPPIPTEAELQQQKAKAMSDAKDSLKTLTKAMFAGKEEKQQQLELCRERTRQFPEDPQAWENFALLLALGKNSSKDEIIHAYRQAETLYLDRGDTNGAKAVTKMIQGIQAVSHP
jgi:hypothetical protein